MSSFKKCLDLFLFLGAINFHKFPKLKKKKDIEQFFLLLGEISCPSQIK